ncbi:hypothetical protein CSC94_18965 [Zhengella mangrovi]|uniref:TraD/TraG TraM recognition site domain-containing protein n=1 Tax=Zhengella mangrovi TaxID=1982044 RepID=A0A2G1QIV3_9HYPH|nr:ATP-binding protein [Zhengella mangrovi]PHP65442.1 hypothetical protein CSC94_18965 [Zhengella mangrovi]
MIPRPTDNMAEGAMMATVFVVVILLIGFFVAPVALVGIPAYLGYRLYRDSPRRHERIAREQTETLLAAVRDADAHLSEDEIRRALLAEVPAKTPRVVQDQLVEVGRRLFEAEHMDAAIPPPPPLHNTIEGARYRDMISRVAQAGMDRKMAMTALASISKSLGVVAREVPPMDGELLVPITHFLDRPHQVVEDVVAPFFELNDYNHFKALRERLDANLAETNRTKPIWPLDYKGDNPAEVYLKGTALFDLFALKAPFGIPESMRFEHTHIVAGTGHGKTQTLQYHIVRDLEDIARGEKTVIVIDSQGDLIKNLKAARTLRPERIVLIDPEDIAYPVCLNLFSVGQERLAAYSALDRERLTNSIIELYDFVLGSLLSAAMTPKQAVVFRYVTRLLFHIPDATIHTFRQVLEPGGMKAFADHIEKLDGTAKSFFANEFDGTEFKTTKLQVLRRLYAVLENRTFERMFSHPQSKFDMFSEMNAGKLILINTAKSLLKEEGTEIFGRFFIALVAQAAQERATIPEHERTPVICYIDEAHEYFDANIATILAQARKFKVGLVMAHQFLGQLDGKLQDAFEANTSIKMAGGISMKDARALASPFNCDPDLLHRQPKGSFVTYVRGLTRKGIPIAFPFFALENLPRSSRQEQDAVREYSRARYAEPFVEPVHETGEPSVSEDDDPNAERGWDATTPDNEVPSDTSDEAKNNENSVVSDGDSDAPQDGQGAKRKRKRKPKPKKPGPDDDPDLGPSGSW